MLDTNVVILGDCIDVLEKMPGGVLDLVVTDPPYLINYKTGHRKDKSHDFNTEIMNDDNPKLIKYYITNCYENLKNDTAMYMFCSADKVDFFKQSIEERFFTIKNMIVWLKNNWTAGDLKHAFGRQYEICFYCNKGKREIEGKRITDVWQFDRVVGKQQLHQNQKPVELIKQCILKSSKEGDLIFDGFGGSGTTAIACLETNRRYILVEKDPKYHEMATKRIEEWHKAHPDGVTSDKKDESRYDRLPQDKDKEELPNTGGTVKEMVDVSENVTKGLKDDSVKTHKVDGETEDFSVPSFVK